MLSGDLYDVQCCRKRLLYVSLTDAGGWSYVEGDPNSQAILENSGTNAGVGNYWEEYTLTGKQIDYMLVEYWSNNYNVEINHLAYGKNIDQLNYQPTLDISGLHLQTTVDDLSSTSFFLNINSAHDTFNGNDMSMSSVAGSAMITSGGLAAMTRSRVKPIAT